MCGLRDVVHHDATIDVFNSEPDLHLCVESGSVDKPMYHVVKIFAGLVDGR